MIHALIVIALYLAIGFIVGVICRLLLARSDKDLYEQEDRTQSKGFDLRGEDDRVAAIAVFFWPVALFFLSVMAVGFITVKGIRLATRW